MINLTMLSHLFVDLTLGESCTFISIRALLVFQCVLYLSKVRALKICLRKISAVSLALIISLSIHGIWAAHASIIDVHHTSQHHELHQNALTQPVETIVSQPSHSEVEPCSILDHEIACCAMASGYYLSESNSLQYVMNESEVHTIAQFQFLRNFKTAGLLRPPQV